MATVYQTETAKRVLWIRQTEHGLFSANYQPKNPKTGKPWQAHRHIEAGRDAYVLCNNHEFVVAKCPAPFEGATDTKWTEGGRWKMGYTGFSTKELAMAALQKYMK
jgi:hypothetical protein